MPAAGARHGLLAEEQGHSPCPGNGLRLMYFAPADMLVPRVERKCTASFCEALTRAGVDVHLVSLDVRLEYDEPTRTMDPREVYGIRSPFPMTTLPTLLRQTSSDLAVTAHRFVSYSAYSAWWALARRGLLRGGRTVFWFRNYLLALPFLTLKALSPERLSLLFEIDSPPRGPRGLALRHMDGLVSVSRIMADELRSRPGVDPERVLVAHQGVDLDLIESMRLPKLDARTRLGLPLDRRLAVYTGKVYRGYGEIELLLATAAHLPTDVLMLIVGGRSDHVEAYRRRVQREGIENVRFTGFVTPAEVFHYQSAADVLVTYYPSGIPLNRYRASPGKLFEYMASHRPIVTADHPALREVLGPDSACFVEPDRPDLLAAAIRQVLADEALGLRMSRRAHADVQGFTWDQRVQRVLGFLHGIHGSGRPKEDRGRR